MLLVHTGRETQKKEEIPTPNHDILWLIALNGAQKIEKKKNLEGSIFP